MVKVLGKIKYLFDVKFPEDGFTEEQEKAYHRIADDIGADFEPFYLEDECTDWPECPNEEEKNSHRKRSKKQFGPTFSAKCIQMKRTGLSLV